jgi:16S rRNA processing protein RimM
MMEIENCFQLGYIVKPHGVHGALTIFLDTDNPEYYNKMESVYVEYQQKLVPFFIESIKPSGYKATVKFLDVDDIDLATQYKGCAIYLPLDMLPSLEEDQFYYHEIIGYKVIDQVVGEIGEIKYIYEANGNDLFAIDYKEKEILVPIRDEFIQKLDKKKSTVFLSLPDGLLDVYLNP